MIPIPLGTKWTVTLTQPMEGHFRCAVCRYESQVVVRAVSQGGGISPLFLDDEGAQEHAYAQAQRALEGAVRHHLELVPCALCGAVGPGAARVRSEQKVPAALFGCFLFLVVGTFGFLAAAVQDSIIGLALAGASSLASAVLGFIGYSRVAVRRRIEFARSSVSFDARLSAPEPEPPLPEAQPVFKAAPRAAAPGDRACPACGTMASASAEFCPQCLGGLPASTSRQAAA
jgi:hypothetical protein